MALHDFVTFCPSCQYEHYLYESGRTDKIEKCPTCDTKMIHTKITAEEWFLIEHISKGKEFMQAMMDLKDKDIIEYQTKISQFRSQARADGCYDKPKHKVVCPKCGGTDIQIVPRKFSLFTGFATNKTDRVCVNCKHKW